MLPLAAALALAACGSSSTPPASPNTSVTASGHFGAAPAVKIPAKKAGGDLFVKTEIQGSGQTLGKAESFLGNYVVYIWSGTSHRLVLSTYTATPQVLSGTLLPGLQTALDGKKMGSRVLAVLPPKYGYGTSGNTQVGVTGTDTLVFVVDMIKTYAPTDSASGTHVSNGGGALPTVTATTGQAPTVKIPAATAARQPRGQDADQGVGPAGGQGPVRGRPVRGAELAHPRGVRLLLVPRDPARLRDRRHPGPDHPRLGQGPARRAGGQPGDARDPAQGRLRGEPATRRWGSRAPTRWCSWSTSWTRSAAPRQPADRSRSVSPSTTSPRPMPSIHTSLASGVPCWLGRMPSGRRMPGVRAYRPSSPAGERGQARPGHGGRHHRQQQGRAERDLAGRQQPGEVLRLDLGQERVGPGGHAVQPGGGLLVGGPLAQPRR